jgi:lipoprotein-anchoring transpeptidase ErfK/SrfK
MPAINGVVIDRLALAGRAWLRPPRLMQVAALAMAMVLSLQAVSAGVRQASQIRMVGVVQHTPASDAGFNPNRVRQVIDISGSLQPLLQSARAVLAGGRNEATVASFLQIPGISTLDAGLEHYAALLDSPDQASRTAALVGVQQYSELIHSLLLERGPHQLIVVSLQAQELRAYDGGRMLLESPITSGRAQLPTDIGAMRILGKASPWTMKSPWPRESPFWYADAQVQMVAWFTTTGESLHDAPWEPLSAYGPGSENGPFASHGCVHVPPAAQTTLFRWAAVGTPVVVIPGDGSPVAAQVAQQSVDASGNPLGDARGD